MLRSPVPPGPVVDVRRCIELPVVLARAPLARAVREPVAQGDGPTLAGGADGGAEELRS